MPRNSALIGGEMHGAASCIDIKDQSTPGSVIYTGNACMLCRLQQITRVLK